MTSTPEHRLDPTFASDNSAGLAPEVSRALAEATGGFAAAYGDEEWTERARRLLADQFGPDVTACFVSTGTAANVLATGAYARPGDQVIASAAAHVYLDELGAVEALTRCSMRPVPHDAGKLTPEALRAELSRTPGVHGARPRILSLAQATELGTVYSPAELTEICALAHDHGMYVHLDGARLANAAAALGSSLREASFGCGVDAVSFGTSKNGGLNAEVVLFRGESGDGELRSTAIRFHKQLGQLHSKQRYLAAQVEAMLRDDVWRTHALAGHESARRLAEGLESAGAKLSYPVQTNAVFATFDAAALERLRRRYLLWDGWQPGELRFMTSFATTPNQIEQLLEIARAD